MNVMGPLIPNGVIDAGWSYLIAFVIGIAFGLIMESSGFSSSRKIVGLFYGYDFTVLRVFFTACFIAMFGLLYMNYAGILDLSMIYFPDTFLTSAIVGGVIMGLGFIVGGFCPGTGIVAAAIGKIDAIVFLIGIFIGIFLFAEIFPLVKDIYFGNPMGKSRINEVVGLSKGMFAFLFVIIAVVAFVVTRTIEINVNKKYAEKLKDSE
jgi:uncharacterized membrane protein YedE/YeeE